MANNKTKSRLVKWTQSFDARVYPFKAINRAIKDYAPLGEFTVHEDSGRIEVTAAIPAESDFHFKEEFSNYVLGMVIKCR